MPLHAPVVPSMKLEIANFPVESIVLGDETRYSDGELKVNPDTVRSLMFDKEFSDDISVHVAHPGDSTRLIHIVDVVEPRYKQWGPGCVFPGIIGPPTQAGAGRTARLDGMAAISTSGPAAGESQYWREAILDMSGPGARYSHFSQTANLIVEMSPKAPHPDVPQDDITPLDTLRGSLHSQRMNVALRKAQIALASFLAEKVSGFSPASVDSFELTNVDPSLPRVIYACQVVRDLLYGIPPGWQPTLLHPNELMDGALFRLFNYVASSRNTIYDQQNNPLVRQLYQRHGKDLNFLGVLLVPAGNEKLTEKELSAGYAAKLLKMLDADGVVISWMGGGHLAIDPMLLVRNCEQVGISASLISPEMARTPDDTGFVYFSPEVGAIVSTGNFEKEIVLPKVDRVIGGRSILMTGDDPQGELTVRIGQILGATQTLGMGKLSGIAY